MEDNNLVSFSYKTIKIERRKYRKIVKLYTVHLFFFSTSKRA